MRTRSSSNKRGPGRSAQWPRPSVAAMAKDTLGFWSQQYVQWLVERNYSKRTTAMRGEHLMNFTAWCEARSVLYPQEITRPILERYQRMLFLHRKPDGAPLSFMAQSTRLVAVRLLFRWLTRRNVVLSNPASEMEMPQVQRSLPRYVLTELEAEAVLAVPDVEEVVGLRDRAILEVLYSTGIRRGELCALRVYDVDHHRGTLWVRRGKGARDRVVPIGERALLWMQKYLERSRPALVLGEDDGALFLSAQGEALTLSRASYVVMVHVRRSGIEKKGSCHLFRHTAATLMLENGADIRYIQHMLGHVKLSTTELYTHVSIHKLKEVHALTHPGAHLHASASTREDNDVDRVIAKARCADGRRAKLLPLVACRPGAVPRAVATPAELHARLEAEAEQEPEHADTESWA